MNLRLVLRLELDLELCLDLAVGLHLQRLGDLGLLR